MGRRYPGIVKKATQMSEQAMAAMNILDADKGKYIAEGITKLDVKA